jgi:HAMP domain-containing protein
MVSSQPAQLSPAADARPKRRRIPIIDARFQWKYTLIITALGAGITTIMGALLYRAHEANTRILDLETSPRVSAQVVRGDQIFLLWLLALVVVMGLALAFWGLVVTHRVSGPLYVLARYLHDIAAGRYPDLRPLRRHDELQEFFAAFEDAVSHLRERDEATAAELQATLLRLRDARDGDPRAACDEALAALEDQRAKLEARLAR